MLRLAVPELARAADRLLDGESDTEAAQDDYERAHEGAVGELTGVFREIATTPRFREAVAWQNRRVLETAVAPFLRRLDRGEPRTAKLREYEELIASYWQRYCTKNESIGFFGPVGWARFDEALPTTQTRAGPTLVDSARVYFENWAIDRLADALVGEPQAREWLAPRRVPYVRVDGGRVRLPAGVSVEVSAPLASVLLRCDGVTPAGEIASAVLAEEPSITGAEEVLALLDELLRRRWIVWGIEVPCSPYPERELRRFLEQLPDVPLRRHGLAKLARLEEARARVEAGAGDADRVDAALAELEGTFADVTGSSPVRHAGRTYGARTTVYLDCHRDLELTLGADFAGALRPLELVIQSGWWVTNRMRERLDVHLRDVYERLSLDGSGPVVLSDFWFECLPVLHEAADAIVDEVISDFQRRWWSVLSLPRDASRTRYAAEEVAGDVLETFAVPDCGWEGARYCSPDVMIAAPDVEAIRRGDFEIVLGDFHLAVNAARSQLFVEQHPAPERLAAEVDVDFPGPRLLPVLPKENPPRLTGRTQFSLVRDVDYLVSLFHQPVDPRRQRLLQSGALAVSDEDGKLVVAVPHGETFDVMDVFAEAALGLMLDAFSIFGREAHTPRVNLDRVVIAREAWYVPVGELTFAFAKKESARYLEARRWQRSLSLPRHVFVSSPLELKPCYVDFDSPVYVNLLAKAIRRVASAAGADDTARIKVAEMLPTLEQAWLVDRQGRRYTSELRLVAVAGPQ